jgi:hypothetical protein
VYFDKCEMRSLSAQSHITQPRAAQNANGFFIVDCNLTAPSGISGCDLGRTVNNNYPYCQSVFINCTMPSTLFLPEGWKLASGTTTDNLRWWEYKSVDPSGNLISVISRLSCSRQLTDAEAVTWRDVNNVFSNTWNPKAVSEPPTVSWQPSPADEATDIASETPLTWAAGAGAESHMIYFGTVTPPPFVEEVTGTSYIVKQFMYAGTTYYWQIDEKNSAGTTTGQVWSFTTGTTTDTTPPNPDPMTWASEPNAIDSNTITMTATTATDASGSGVQYYFTNVTDPNHDSGWQDSTIYTDTDLNNNTIYTYKVKACDNSFNHNMTADSNDANVSTLRFDCSQTPVSDLDEDCQVTLADYVILANEWLRPRLETELIVNGTFDSELAPWQDVNAIGAIGIMTATFDGSIGLPPGSAALDANASTTAVNHHRFYQAFPVTIGSKYMLSGKWSGSLADPAYSSWNDWIEVYIGFNSTATPSSWGSKMYRKLFRGVGNSGNINFAPDSNGTWEWEDITDSQNTNPAPPEDNIFTASQNYMVVAFNLGGQSGTGLVYLNLDNIKVVECLVSPADLNKDCELNLLDLAQFALDWLGCNRIPSGECWQ